MAIAPVISVVGKSNVGKTTLLEKLVAELARRGHRVATIKHDTHGFDIDKPGKDTWRLAQAGSAAVVISSPTKMALIRNVEREATLDEIAAMLEDDVDLILTEGYKRGNKPKIEVFRQGAVPREGGDSLLCTEDELIAIATDTSQPLHVPQFGLDDAAGLADFLEEKYISKAADQTVSLTINGVRMRLKEFPTNVIDRTIKGLVSALDNVPEEGTIVLKVYRGRK